MLISDVLLARHGAFDGVREQLAGRSPVTLNDEGFAQAEALAQAASAVGVTRVMSSPQVRAVQTAAAVARECRTTVEFRPELDEIDFGAWTGRPFTALANDPQWAHFNSSRDDSHIPGGEALVDVQRRVAAGLTVVARAVPGERALVVTHAEIIRAALLLAYRKSWSEWNEFEIGPGTVTWLSYDSLTPTVRAIGLPPQELGPRRPRTVPSPHART